jgi:lipopolysaccharide biosynthesis glycosyltransferase
MVFHQKIFRLPNEWNVMIANIIDNIDEYHLPDNLRKEYFESRKNPKIIHYVGKGLPCFSLNSDLYEYFWKYARITPFYEKLIQQSMEQYTHNVMHYYLSENSITSKIKRYIKLLIDKLFPMGSKRRKFVKEKILNKREIYYSK